MQKICIVNKRKSNILKNGINNKIKKGKIVIVMSSFLLVINLLLNIVSAESNENFGKYNVYSYKDSNRYITYQNRPQRIHEYYYIDKNSNELPAYCMTFGLNGAETVTGGYGVSADRYLSDNIVNNIILNGYPYKTVGELGLLNESEARYATQFAIWVKLENLDINQILPMETQYTRVVDAIKTIYNNGLNFNKNYTNGIEIKEVEKSSILDEKDKEFYSKTYELKYGENVLDINLEVSGISGYFITDENNNKIDSIVGHKKIKLLFPRRSNEKENICDIKVNTTYKEKAVMFATSETFGMQDVSLTLVPVKQASSKLNFKTEVIDTKLTITKKDETDESIFIPGVRFNIYDTNNKLLGEFITNKEGKIDIDIEKDLKIYRDTEIIIKEIEAPYPYIIGEENIQKILINVGENKKIEFKNKKIQEKKETKENKEKVELPKTGC